MKSYKVNNSASNNAKHFSPAFNSLSLISRMVNLSPAVRPTDPTRDLNVAFVAKGPDSARNNSENKNSKTFRMTQTTSVVNLTFAKRLSY